MKKKSKWLRLTQAYRLYMLGLTVEGKRKKLQTLAEQGFAYNSAEMLRANEEFSRVAVKWQKLESDYLKTKRD